jgi:hypothetical protein
VGGLRRHPDDHGPQWQQPEAPAAAADQEATRSVYLDLRHPDLKSAVRRALAQEALASTGSISPEPQYLRDGLT